MMSTKFTFSTKAWHHERTRLVNQIFKLLPLYEEKKDWLKQQSTLVLELKGYNEMFQDCPGFMVLAAKLLALNFAEDQMVFRKLIFEAISELQGIEMP